MEQTELTDGQRMIGVLSCCLLIFFIIMCFVVVAQQESGVQPAVFPNDPIMEKAYQRRLAEVERWERIHGSQE